ncbi:MAG TPA: GNAT family N-acetyltransferase [Xanthobacteraceae bacterium]|nr:GNAT family N-acetyltransferase [Xanthobacteraceae bacterium]
MIVRRAGPADVEAIAQVHVQAWRESYPDLLPWSEIDARPLETRAAQWRNTLIQLDRPTFVADEDGAVAGFVSGGTVMWSGLSTDGEVSALYLLDAIKRRGFGRALFGAMLGELAARGIRSAGLRVLTANAPARRFYEAMGGRLGESRLDRRGEFVFDEVAYIWEDLTAFEAPCVDPAPRLREERR